MSPRGLARSIAASGATLDGGCLCGAVRYRLRHATADVAHCHCATCRKASGAAFVTWATLPRGDVTLLAGEPTGRRSSSHATRWFCAACGTQLFLDDDDEATLDVTQGSLDTPDAVTARYNCWVDGRLDGMKGFDRDLPDDPDGAVGGPPRE